MKMSYISNNGKALLKKLSVLVLIAVVSGCAVFEPPPPAPKESLAKGSKVGLLVMAGSESEHLHIGTTVFNNFSHPVKLPWDLKARSQESFARALSNAGFEVVELKDSGFDGKSFDSMIVKREKEWIVNPEAQQVVARLRNDLHLDALVFVSEGTTRVRNECSNFGCSETYMKKSGLFTRGMFLSTRYFSVSAMKVSAYRLDIPSNLSVYDPLQTALGLSVRMLKDFPDPKDLGNLSDIEFAPVADSISDTVNQLATATASVLAGSAKVP